ncbi:hypothetical protein BDF19DRAFT_420464 [Syncephalis fuscata]|nr:hypothetical protein BDF19DRAFT_420464 [Syncephalis fuscata]
MLSYTLELIKELAVDEREFLQKLSAIEKFLQQLHQEAIWCPPHSLYQHLDAIRQCSAQIIQVTKNINPQRITQIVGHIFHWMIVSDLAYSEYVANMVKLQYCIDLYVKNNVLIRAPINRVIAYKSFLTAFTETSVAKHELLSTQFSEAVARFSSIADILYRTDQLIEEYKKLITIQDRIVVSANDHKNLIEPIVTENTFESRRLISKIKFHGFEMPDSGDYSKILQVETQELFVILLFNDVIVVCKPSTVYPNKDLCLFIPPVPVTKVSAAAIHLSTQKELSWSFELTVDQNEPIILQTSSEAKRNAWLSKFNEIRSLETDFVTKNHMPTVSTAPKSSSPPPLEGSELMCRVRNISLQMCSTFWPTQTDHLSCSRVVIELRRTSGKQKQPLIVAFVRPPKHTQSSNTVSQAPALFFWQWLVPSMEVRQNGSQITLGNSYRFEMIRVKFAQTLYNIIHKEQLRQLMAKQQSTPVNYTLNTVPSPETNEMQACIMTTDGWHYIGSCVFAFVNCGNDRLVFSIRHAITRRTIISADMLDFNTTVDLLSKRTLRVTILEHSSKWILGFRGSEKNIHLAWKNIRACIKHAKKAMTAPITSMKSENNLVGAVKLSRTHKEEQLKKLFSMLVKNKQESLNKPVLFEQLAKVYAVTGSNQWQCLGLGKVQVIWNYVAQEKQLVCSWPERRQSFLNIKLVPAYMTVSVDVVTACTAMIHQMYVKPDMRIYEHQNTLIMDDWPAPVIIVQFSSTHLAESLAQCVVEENSNNNQPDGRKKHASASKSDTSASLELFEADTSTESAQDVEQTCNDQAEKPFINNTKSVSQENLSETTSPVLDKVEVFKQTALDFEAASSKQNKQNISPSTTSSSSASEALSLTFTENDSDTSDPPLTPATSQCSSDAPSEKEATLLTRGNVQRLAQLWSAANPDNKMQDKKAPSLTTPIPPKPLQVKQVLMDLETTNSRNNERTEHISNHKLATPIHGKPVSDMILRFEGKPIKKVTAKPSPCFEQPPVAQRVPEWWPILPRAIKNSPIPREQDIPTKKPATQLPPRTSVLELVASLNKQ